MESMLEHSAISAAISTEAEAYQTLLARAHRKTGRVPPELIVRHVLSVTARRRLAGPARRARGAAPPFRVRPGRRAPDRRAATAGSAPGPLRDPAPRLVSAPVSHPAPSRRAALGELRLPRFPPKLARPVQAPARRAGGRGLETARPRQGHGASRVPNASPLRWDPVRPLTGPGDWLAQVRWVDGAPDRGLRRWLRPAKGGGWSARGSRGAGAAARRWWTSCSASLRDGHGEPALHALLQEDRRRDRARDPGRPGPRAASGERSGRSSSRSIPISARRSSGSSRGGGSCSPTTWASARPRRRSPPATSCGAPGRVRRGPARRSRRAQAAVAARVAALHRRPRRRRRRQPRRAPRRVRRAAAAASSWSNYEQLLRDLDVVRDWTPGPRRARRGAADQELGDQDRAYVKRLRSALPAGADRHADGEPARRAGLDRRVGRRPRARAEVAAGAVARDAGGREDARSAARGNLDTLRDAARRLHGPARPPGGARPAPAADRHRVPVEMTDEQVEEHDGAQPADRAAHRPRRSGGRSPRRSSCG